MSEIEVTFEVKAEGKSSGGVVHFNHEQTASLLRAHGFDLSHALPLVRDLVKEAVCCALTEASRRDHGTESSSSDAGCVRVRRR